jgi:adenylate cyclase
MRALARLVKPRRPRLLVQTLALTLAIAGVVIALGGTPVGERLEQRTVDARFAERGKLPAPKEVVVVAIDRRQDTFANSWPLSREIWANAIDELSARGVAGIAIDVPMDWKAFAPTEDDAFVRAVEASDVPIVLARRAGGEDERGRLGSPLAGLKGSARGELDEDSYTSGVSARIEAADGVVREYPVRGTWHGERAPGLAAALVSAAGGGDAVERAPDTMLLDQYGPRGSFEHVSFADIAYGLDTFRELEGKLVVIGPTEGIARDDHDVPMGSSMSSAELQATAVANLLDRSWLREPAPWVSAAASVALALAIWALLLVVPLGLSVPASIALVAGWCWGAVALFERGLVVPMLAPAFAGAAAFAALTMVLVVLSVRERVRVKGLFARYVHADVVRELIDGDDELALNGEAREITVLFSDIRGFTSLSEQVDPVEMVAQLNEYFEAMVEVVAAEQGAVDKFLGDGLMAIFGAPARQEDHALRASRAAIAMLDRLEDVNHDREQRGLAPLRIGIGIHTGRAVVGNVGSPPFRVDFTAIGDTVNLAARLEAMTKELGAVIVVSDATRDAVTAHDIGGHDAAGELRFDELGTVVARGRTEPTRVFSLDRAGRPRAAGDAARDADSRDAA